uniref:Uncharacterized protein n=1 Tax=Vombatus ursinus TaxID=29139 RepID=A0A4X2KNY3_VOMUR
VIDGGIRARTHIFTLKQVGSNTEQMILINPHALNLKTYRHKVEQAVKSYERRLNLLIWKAFSPEEREKFKIQEPVQYLENKEAIQEALQEANWPISLEDVLLLENEIQAGNTYIQQTKEIQEATKKEDCQGDQSSEVMLAPGFKTFFCSPPPSMPSEAFPLLCMIA